MDAIPFEAYPGQHVSGASADMVATAAREHRQVTCDFNGIILSAEATTTVEDIVAAYKAEITRRHDAYLASPEYAEQQRKARERERTRKDALQEALRTAPARITLIDEAAWNTGLSSNTDSYGAAVYRYADAWARVMEAHVSAGQTIEQCAKDDSSTADTEGITGFMYGCAVAILCRCWIHGEALRRWHNHDTQIGNEGDEANETGTVLNPAVLSI